MRCSRRPPRSWSGRRCAAPTGLPKHPEWLSSEYLFSAAARLIPYYPSPARSFGEVHAVQHGARLGQRWKASHGSKSAHRKPRAASRIRGKQRRWRGKSPDREADSFSWHPMVESDARLDPALKKVQRDLNPGQHLSAPENGPSSRSHSRRGSIPRGHRTVTASRRLQSAGRWRA